MAKNYISFNGGISTAPEVNELLDKIGVPKPGDEIHYSTISQIIGIPNRRAARWQSIVGAWRRRLEREHNILLYAVENEGYKAMYPIDRVKFSAKKFRQGIKSVSRAVIVAQATDRAALTDEDKRTLDHVTDTGLKLRNSAAIEARKLKELSAQAEALG